MKQHKSALITQSNYVPWKGYFDAIQLCESFIVLDDVQFTRRDWRNRNLIKTPKGLKWLTIPVEVKGKYFQKIKDTRVAEKNWMIAHWDVLSQNYKTAPCFNEMSKWLEPLYKNCSFEFLTEINLHFIRGINEFLGIDTEIRFSSEFELPNDKSLRLVEICKQIGAEKYHTGAAAKAYLNEDVFRMENISVNYLDYSGYPEYPQLYSPFEHGVSVLDLIFNTGSDCKKFMKNIL